MNFWKKIFRGTGQEQTAEEKRGAPAIVAEKQEKKDRMNQGRIGGGVLCYVRATEKTSAQRKGNWYVFSVESERNKTEVKRAVENRFGVKAEEVRIANMPAKMRRRGRIIGWKRGFKKAAVRIKDGQVIENI